MNDSGTPRGYTFTQRATVAVAIGLLALAIVYFLRQVAGVLLVLFAGVMVAVFLDGLTRLVQRVLSLARPRALLITILTLLVITVLGLWFLGAPLAAQLTELVNRLPQDIARIRAQIEDIAWLSSLLKGLPPPQQFFSLSQDLVPRVFGLFSTAFGALASAFVIVFVGIYLAISPSLYIAAATRLAPPAKRPRLTEVFGAAGQALRHWLVGRFSSMCIVGFLTGLGLWMLGMPVPVSLGFITGLIVFIPYIGPILSAIPALLIALGQGLTMALYVLLLYAGVQFVESYFITPLIQERAVSLPPAFLISAQVVVGVLFGLIGVVLAAPLIVLITVIVQMLYIQDVLGDTSAHVLGEEPLLEKPK